MIVDLILNTLAMGPSEVTNNLRVALMHMLFDVLNYQQGMDQFNTKFESRTRIHRLKILLYHLNEELPPCEEILCRVKYKSIVFEKILAAQQIRYTLILDRSGSMVTHDHHGQPRWDIAKDAMKHMAEQVERLTNGSPHGITLWMFSSPPHNKYSGLRKCDEVEKVFEKEKPGGATDLAGVLENAFEDHFTHKEQEHILVVTDGEPNSQDAVITALVQNINRLQHPEELGITFMQVGCCEQAAEFLHDLQDHLIEKGAKYNVVDALTHEDYDKLSLCDIIRNYLPIE